MVKKCCVYGCRTNYNSELKIIKKRKNNNEGTTVDSNVKISVFRFPKDPVERERWIKVIPTENLIVHNDTVICASHWPSNFETITFYGKPRPKHPPSVWDGIPSSQIPTLPPPPRTTQKSLSSVRNRKEDELGSFLELDKTSFTDLKDTMLFNKRNFVAPVTSYMVDKDLHIQSAEFDEGLPSFIIKIYENLRFDSYHYGIKCYVNTLSKNYITTVHSWSILDEIIRFISTRPKSNKQEIMQQEIKAMSAKSFGTKVYGPDIIIRAFEYFATSRSLYKRIRNDYQLPSISTLTRITSKVSKVSEHNFLHGVFKSLEEDQRYCVLLHDEIYVKKMLLYHGGTLFGKSVDDPASLAQTLLGIMLVCFHGGPKFLSKMLPISRLNSDFLFNQIDVTNQAITTAGGRVKAIICDGNRTNQSFFKKFETLPGKPWLNKQGQYLLYDYVHLLKNIRNLWLTEKMGELQFKVSGEIKTAKWCHLKELYELERDSTVKMSSLNEMAVAPKPVERQRVSTCLKVFDDKTCQALLNHPGISEGKEETALFLKIVITWWKIINVKGKGADVRHNDSLQAVISDTTDKRLDIILEFGDMIMNMAGKQGHRIKQLSKDTAFAVYHTCNGLVDLCRHLLTVNHDYVCLGKFTTDHLEKEFGKLRQGSGGTYFISVQQVIEKLQIKKTSLLLSLNCDIDEFNVEAGHHCSACSYLLCEEGSEIFDSLVDLEESISRETKMSLVYIAGYITRKDRALSEMELLDQTNFYYKKYGDYTDSLDRGGLNVPSDHACQWTFFCYVMFNTVKDKICRASLTNIFMSVAEFYSFNMERCHGNILANIFIKNHCVNVTPRSGKEPSLKVLKLSQ